MSQTACHLASQNLACNKSIAANVVRQRWALENQGGCLSKQTEILRDAVCPCCLQHSRNIQALAQRHVASANSGGRPLPRVQLKDFQQFQKWGPQKAPPDLGRFFSFGKKKLPDIVQESEDPLVLRDEAEDIAEDRFGTEELKDLAEEMISTMRAAPGVGLAAPQIGLGQKIIVLEEKEEYLRSIPKERLQKLQREPFGPLILCNPKLQAVGIDGYRYWEGCLSVRGYQALVERYLTVRVSARGLDGSEISFKANGWKARILQHECDHVNGVLYIDRAVENSFTIMKPQSETGMEFPIKPGPCICKHRLQ